MCFSRIFLQGLVPHINLSDFKESTLASSVSLSLVILS